MSFPTVKCSGVMPHYRLFRHSFYSQVNAIIDTHCSKKEMPDMDAVFFVKL